MMGLSTYIEAVVDGLDKRWTDQKFRQYVGISKTDIRNTITDIEELTLIKRDVYALWEQDVPVEAAVEELYEPLDRYYQGTASVM